MVVYSEWLGRLTALALCALIFTLPFSKSAVEACFCTAFAAWILKRIFSCELPAKLFSIFKPPYTRLNLPIYLFITAGVISVLVSTSIALSLKGLFFKLLEGVLLYFIITETINDKKKLNMILTSMILSMVLIGADGIFQRITGWDFIRHYRIIGWDHSGINAIYFRRISASFMNPNGFGGWLVIMVPLIFSIAAADKKHLPHGVTKPAAWILAGVLTACIVLTLSKGALTGFCFSAIFFITVIFSIRFNKARLFLIIVALVITAALLISICIINSCPIPAVSDTKTISTDSWQAAQSPVKDFLFLVKKSLASIMLAKSPIRTNLWYEAIQVIKHYPVFGCGLNTYSIVAPHYKVGGLEGGSYPHNSYLQMTAETGFVGLACFMWIMFRLFKVSIRNFRKINDKYFNNILIGLLTGFIGFLAHSFFDVNFYALQLATLMWFVMGLIIAVQNIALKELDA